VDEAEAARAKELEEQRTRMERAVEAERVKAKELERQKAELEARVREFADEKTRLAEALKVGARAPCARERALPLLTHAALPSAERSRLRRRNSRPKSSARSLSCRRTSPRKSSKMRAAPATTRRRVRSNIRACLRVREPYRANGELPRAAKADAMQKLRDEEEELETRIREVEAARRENAIALAAQKELFEVEKQRLLAEMAALQTGLKREIEEERAKRERGVRAVRFCCVVSRAAPSSVRRGEQAHAAASVHGRQEWRPPVQHVHVHAHVSPRRVRNEYRESLSLLPTRMQRQLPLPLPLLLPLRARP
jgi:hypothetical protein